MHVLRDTGNLEWSSQVPSSLFTANLRELTLVYQRIQIQKLSPIYPKETESKTLSPSWDDDNRCPQLSFFLEMLCCRRTIVLDPQHGRDSACPQFLLLFRFIFHMISKLSPGRGINSLSHLYITKQHLLSNWFSQNENATNFILYSLFCLGRPLPVSFRT